MPSWHSAQLKIKHRDKFTFTFTYDPIMKEILYSVVIDFG
jgi:hypothetical protein